MADRENCPLRHKNGNCLPIGGFCTAVNESICEGLYMAFEHGRSNPQWISVKDRLPDKSGKYLTVTEYNVIEAIEYSAKYKLFNHFDELKPYGQEITTITHWMPLPEPPEEI